MWVFHGVARSAPRSSRRRPPTSVGRLRAFSASKNGTRRGERVGFPHFQKKRRGPESFRLRNKVSRTGRHDIRVGEKGARLLTLPVIGPVALREDTRRLRRMLRPGPGGVPRARICSATVTIRRGRIVVTLTCELADLHLGMRHQSDNGARRSFVGVDRGLSHLVVVAGSDRSEWGRIDPPRHLVTAGPAIALSSRSISRKVPGSANRAKARARLGRLHGRLANRHHDFTHRLSSQIAKTHGAICIEDLAVKNMVKNHHLARSINDAAWGELGSQLRYKAEWYGATLVVAPRFFASTKTCSSCGWACEQMTLAQRVFACTSCGLIADRDTNAAANLAAWGEAEQCSATQAPDPEARGRVTKACGGRSAGHHLGDGGTAPETPDPGEEAGTGRRASGLTGHPRRVVSRWRVCWRF